MNCNCNDSFADKIPPLTLPEVCATCGKRTGEDGLDSLKACSQCKAIKYCSRECQKSDWPNHKPTCRVDLAKGGMRALLRAAVYGHPLVHRFIMFCAVILHGLDTSMPASTRRRLIQKPLYMRMDVGIEPVDINETIRLCQDPDSYNVRSVEGMLQIYRISLDTSGNNMTQGGDMAVAETRERLNAMGQGDVPFVDVTIVNSDEMGIRLSLFLPSAPMPVHLPEHQVFLGQTVSDRTIMLPKLADYINHLNEHIRADKDNSFSLRTKMRREDKQLIVDAMKGDPFPPAVYCRQKMMREPRYKPLWELFKQKQPEALNASA